MTDLDRILATLSDAVDWPEPSEHLTTRVAARVESLRRPAIGLWRWAWIAVVAVFLVVALIPGTRRAVANLFQEAGVRIGFIDEVPSDLGGDLHLGQLVTVEEAASRVGLDLRYPQVLGPPAETYIDTAGLVSMLWEGPVLLTQRAGGVAYAEKAIGSDTSVTGVDLDGGSALWVEGAEHSFTYLDARGDTIEETTRLAGNVLLWSRDDVDYRLELTTDLARALEIAESMTESR